MIYGSVCSGIGAPEFGWSSLGWACAFMSEIEPFAREVLKTRFPGVPLHGDFTTIERGMYADIDLLVGGTPCQAFSIAGLRGGMADERGNLALQFLRLAQRLQPRWIVWENVPGVFSSKSHDAPDPREPENGMEMGGGASWLTMSTTRSSKPTSTASLPAFSNAGMGSPTERWTLNLPEYHSAAVACSLSDILEIGDLPRRYFLSAKACRGILRRAVKRGKDLPQILERPLLETGMPRLLRRARMRGIEPTRAMLFKALERKCAA